MIRDYSVIAKIIVFNAMV